MMKTLCLEKRGCDFRDNKIKKMSDVGNYRVGSYDYSIIGKDGRKYILEFGGYEKKEYQTHTKNGKELKKGKLVTVLENALYIDTQFEEERENVNGCWRNIELEKQLSRKNYTYNLEYILECVNEISIDEYTEIAFI